LKADTEAVNAEDIVKLNQQIQQLDELLAQTKEKCATTLLERDFLLEEKKAVDATRQGKTIEYFCL
jgi:hypothetical protein